VGKALPPEFSYWLLGYWVIFQLVFIPYYPITIYLITQLQTMLTKQNATQFITAEVARYGKVTPVGMQIYRESKMKFSDFAKATRRGLELYEAYQSR